MLFEAEPIEHEIAHFRSSMGICFQQSISTNLQSTYITMKDTFTDQQLISEHLSNERTFLAWIRTGIGIMAFGFVAVKFSRMVRRANPDFQSAEILKMQWPELFGIALTISGGLMIMTSYFRYKKSVRLMREGVYTYSTFHLTIMASLLFVISVVLVACLLTAPLDPSTNNAAIPSI